MFCNFGTNVRFFFLTYLNVFFKWGILQQVHKARKKVIPVCSTDLKENVLSSIYELQLTISHPHKGKKANWTYDWHFQYDYGDDYDDKTSSKILNMSMQVSFKIITSSMEAVHIAPNICRRYIRFDKLTQYFGNSKYRI